MDWNKLKEFLRQLGVEMEESDAQAQQVVPGEPVITLLQQARHHEAFYRIDVIETRVELLILLPDHCAPLKFHFYLVQLHESHPLFDVLARLVAYREGSEEFEQQREFIEWQILSALVETMKVLFWAGQETSRFPHEITVQKIL